ncbi:MAG: hypothetical protein II625_06775 [Bacilli bacterium]|nr:hypothetical protein [Bacilli bacterium]
MSEYNTSNINIGSYGDLKDGSSTIRKASSNLKTGVENADGYFKGIQKPRVFEGPVAEYVNDVWNAININTNNNISTLENSANTLDRVNANYHDTDRKSSNDVGGVI